MLQNHVVVTPAIICLAFKANINIRALFMLLYTNMPEFENKKSFTTKNEHIHSFSDVRGKTAITNIYSLLIKTE